MGRGGERLHEWMFEVRSGAESQAFETDHFSSIGALIIARRMADLGVGPYGEEPTFHAPVADELFRRGVLGPRDRALDQALAAQPRSVSRRGPVIGIESPRPQRPPTEEAR